jgi:hypothetical protein
MSKEPSRTLDQAMLSAWQAERTATRARLNADSLYLL